MFQIEGGSRGAAPNRGAVTGCRASSRKGHEPGARDQARRGNLPPSQPPSSKQRGENQLNNSPLERGALAQVSSNLNELKLFEFVMAGVKGTKMPRGDK